MTSTEVVRPETVQEAGEIMAYKILENLEQYRAGEKDSFSVVFCPDKGIYSDNPSVHDYALKRFLDDIDLEYVEPDVECLVLKGGVKLFFKEYFYDENSKPFQIIFSSEPQSI